MRDRAYDLLHRYWPGAVPAPSRRSKMPSALAAFIPLVVIGAILLSVLLIALAVLTGIGLLTLALRQRWRQWRMAHHADGRRNVRVISTDRPPDSFDEPW